MHAFRDAEGDVGIKLHWIQNEKSSTIIYGQFLELKRRTGIENFVAEDETWDAAGENG